METLVPADPYHEPLEALDEEVEKVTSGIERAMKDCIPIIRYRVLPAPFYTDRMRGMEAEAPEAMSDIRRGLNRADDQRRQQTQTATWDKNNFKINEKFFRT